MSWERNIVLKSPQELAVMREAGRINAKALAAVRKLVRPGVTTAELDAAAEEVIRKHGGIPTFKGYPGPYPFLLPSNAPSMNSWCVASLANGS
jgi:methionyl aminopeptidase